MMFQLIELTFLTQSSICCAISSCVRWSRPWHTGHDWQNASSSNLRLRSLPRNRPCRFTRIRWNVCERVRRVRRAKEGMNMMMITSLISVSINFSHLPSTAATLKCALNSMDLHAERSSYLLSLIVHVWFGDSVELGGEVWFELFGWNLCTANWTTVVTCCWRSAMQWFFRTDSWTRRERERESVN